MTPWAHWRLALFFCLFSSVSYAFEIPLSILQVAPPCAENCFIYFITESWGNVSCGALSQLECWCTVSGNLFIPLGSGAEQCTSFCDPNPAAEKQASNICNGVSVPPSGSSTSSSISITTTTSTTPSSSTTTSFSSTTTSATLTPVPIIPSSSTTLLTASSTNLGSATSSVSATAVPGGNAGSSHLSTGALVGLVIGIVFLTAVATVLIWLVFRRRQKKRKASNTPEIDVIGKRLDFHKLTPETENAIRFSPENMRNEPGYNRMDFNRPGLTYTRSPPPIPPPPPVEQRLDPQTSMVINHHLRRPEQLRKPDFPPNLRLAAIPVLTPLRIPGAGPTPRAPQKNSPKHDRTPLLSSPISKEDISAQLAQSISLAASPISTTPSTTLPLSQHPSQNASRNHIAMMSKHSTMSASPASTASRDHPAMRPFRTAGLVPVEAPERTSAQRSDSAMSSAGQSEEEFPITFDQPRPKIFKPIWQMTPPSAISPQNDPLSAFYNPSPMSPNEPWNNLQNGGYFSTTPQAPVMYPDNNHTTQLGKHMLTPINEEGRDYIQVRQRAEQQAESPAATSSPSPRERERDYIQVRHRAEQYVRDQQDAGSSRARQVELPSEDNDRSARDSTLSSVLYPRVPSLKHRSGQIRGVHDEASKPDRTYKLSLPPSNIYDEPAREDNGSPRLPKRSPARLQKPSVEEYSPPHLTIGSSVTSWQSLSERAEQSKPEIPPEPVGFRVPRRTDTWRTSISSQYSRATTQPQGLRKPSPILGSPFKPVERNNQDPRAYGR